MCGNRQRGDDTDPGVRQERGSNHDPVRKIMQPIAHEDHQATAPGFLPVMAVVMAVPITLVVM